MNNKKTLKRYDWLYEDVIKTGLQKTVRELKDSCVMITGATGLIGSMLCRGISNISAKESLGIRIYALVRDVKKAEVMLSDTKENGNVLFAEWNGKDLLQVSKTDYIIHTACPTKSSFFINNPVETIKSIVNGTDIILKYAADQKVKSFVYLSSMEVYGLIEEERFLLPEDTGYINNLSLRSSYPESKRIAELLSLSYKSEYDVPVKIVRLAQTFGPGIPENDNRVFAQFLKAAESGNDIVMHTEGKSKRMYLDTMDAVSAILTVLVKGKNGVVYNAANEENYCSIKKMAEMVINEFGNGNNKVIVDRDKDRGQYPPDNILKLDVTPLKNLGWKPVYGLKDMYKRMSET